MGLLVTVGVAGSYGLELGLWGPGWFRIVSSCDILGALYNLNTHLTNSTSVLPSTLCMIDYVAVPLL